MLQNTCGIHKTYIFHLNTRSLAALSAFGALQQLGLSIPVGQHRLVLYKSKSFLSERQTHLRYSFLLYH